MHLPEGAGKGGLATLVRTGYDNYALVPLQRKIIADHGRVFVREFIGQSYIKSFINVNFPRRSGNVRIAEFQSGSFEAGDVLQVGDIKLYFPVKDGNRFIQILPVSRTIII